MTNTNKFIDEAFAMFEKTLHYVRTYVAEHRDELERRYGASYLAIVENGGVTEVLVSFVTHCTKTSVWRIRAESNTINRILHIDSDKDKRTLIQRLQANGDQRGIVVDTITILTKPNISNN